MKNRNSTRSVLGVTLALVGLMSWVTQAGTNITREWSSSSQTPVLAPRANGKIAYVMGDGSNNNEIHVMNADGSNQMNITGSPGADGAPSPDGKKIAFTSGSDIYVMNANGSNPTRLTNDPAHDYEPGWSPDSARIVFTRLFVADVFSTVSVSEIYVMNADGTNQTKLSTNSTTDSQPAWSPDGTRIAFTRGYAIYLMNSDGSNPTRLTDIRNWQPCWSPDGARIAFTSERDGNLNFEIYVMNANGKHQRRLTRNSSRDTEPTWSPDGARIAFTSNRNGNDEIYAINPDGSDQTRLTNGLASDVEPVWSLDSTKIVFRSIQVRQVNVDIYLINPDGSNQVNVTNNPATDYGPAWSPDGARIAFATNRDGNFEIYVMNADGSNPKRLTTIRAENDLYPAWSPDGTRIAFASNGIWVVNSDGNNLTQLTNRADSAPAWSPDGTRVAFASNGIWVVNAGGTNLTQLTDEFDSGPAWSPDGQKIAFTRRASAIYVMDADGGNQKRLTNDAELVSYSAGPVWSPDGTRIAFTRGRDISDQLIPDEIYVMNADGSNQVNLTNNPSVSEGGPAWSPDGTSIAYSIVYSNVYSIAYSGDGIFVMKADGSGKTKIPNAHGFGAWQPLSSAGCPESVSPTGQSFDANGGTGSFNVTAGSECSWTALSDASWISITSGSSSGSGNISYSVAANSSTGSRTAGLIVGGHLVIATQAGVPVKIISVSVEGKSLLIVGENFDPGAVILRNGVEQMTAHDPQHPQTALISKKAGKKIRPGDKLQVRNPNGSVSREFTFPN